MITGFHVPAGAWTRRSMYLKIRDRQSYEFAAASAAVALDIDGGVVRQARIAVGGMTARPWRARAAEAALVGQAITEQSADLGRGGGLRRGADPWPQRLQADPSAAAPWCGPCCKPLRWRPEMADKAHTRIGEPAVRVDARLKVTGQARYPSDMTVANPAYAWLVTSSISKGRIRRFDLTAARAVRATRHPHLREHPGRDHHPGRLLGRRLQHHAGDQRGPARRPGHRPGRGRHL